ncbi:major capsid protein P2 [Vibrio splendidus]|uniref:major capsid protein P2 n=1 Tax=Vibrio splendidus TaxID=29497 RepID=UPI0022358D62|nr:major capsid protein P2 [Vibrio splendidus]MCW4446826.1 major capsid protein P2 [Vibrio splendidus]
MITPMKLNSFTGIGYGQKSTVNLSVGPTYEEIILETNLEASKLKRVAISLQGEEIYVLTGEQLLMLEAYKGLPSKAGMFTIPFSDITGKTKNGIRSTGLVTERGDNITLEVEVASVADESAEPDIALKAWAMISEAQPVRIVVPKIKSQSMQATAAGDNEFLNLVSGQRVAVRRMHFLSDKVTELAIHRDYKKVFEASREFTSHMGKRNGKFAQVGVYHFDPIQRGFYLQDLFATAHAAELKFTVTTSDVVGSLPILVESVEFVRPDLMG